nr:hypothetical protein CFP56_04412 [Quercus suber]
MDGAVHHDADQDEGDEHTRGPAVRQRRAAADEETGADGASDGDHLEMSSLQTPLQGGVGGIGRGILHIVDLAVGAGMDLRRGMCVRIASEAVDEARRPGGLVWCMSAVLSVVVGDILARGTRGGILSLADVLVIALILELHPGLAGGEKTSSSRSAARQQETLRHMEKGK